MARKGSALKSIQRLLASLLILISVSGAAFSRTEVKNELTPVQNVRLNSQHDNRVEFHKLQREDTNNACIVPVVKIGNEIADIDTGGGPGNDPDCKCVPLKSCANEPDCPCVWYCQYL